ncbi:MAG: tetratricopeptide repeat protein [Anaerolineae bacterium]
MARMERSGALWLSMMVIVFLAVGCGTSRPAAGEVPAPAPPAAGTRPAGNAADHVVAGQAALDAGDLAKAEREFLDAVALDPKLARAQFGLGNVYVRQGRLPEAEKAFKAALASDPKLAPAQANLGVVYYQMGQLAQAAAAFEAALRLEPDDAANLYLLAVVRLQENNLAEAERLLMRARERKPDLPEVYYGLGVLYRLKGQKDEAIQAFEKFLAIGPGQDPTAMDYARQELKQLRGQ